MWVAVFPVRADADSAVPPAANSPTPERANACAYVLMNNCVMTIQTLKKCFEMDGNEIYLPASPKMST